MLIFFFYPFPFYFHIHPHLQLAGPKRSNTLDHQTPPLTTMEKIARTSRSPLHIPELLDHTFSFLSDFTITHTVILVCRQWLHVGQHRIVREQVWQSSFFKFGRDALLEKIGRVDRLCSYYSENYVNICPMEVLWRALGERSREHRFLDWEQRRLQQRQQPSTGSGYIKPWLTPEEAEDEDTAVLPLKELRLHGYMDLSNLKEVLPALAHLTSLEIWTVHIGFLSMLDILESCPLLQRLCIDSSAPVGRVLIGPWFTPARINPRNGQTRRQTPLALRSLVLRNVSVPQSCLETLITLTPHLRELILVIKEFFHAEYQSGDAIAIAAANVEAAKRVREFVKLHHPGTLRSFFFSPPYSVSTFSTDTIQDWIQDSPAPHSSLDWTFEGPELTPHIITHITTLVPNTITTLHILGACPDLHNYLCASPHLLHLMAPKSAIQVEHLDIHFRSTQGHPPLPLPPLPSTTTSTTTAAASGSYNQLPKIWACRRLKTLHIAVFSPMPTASFSRLVFGYISRVCPKLQDLEIHGPEYLYQFNEEWRTADSHRRICVRLESGLCLLSRLKDLERLVVGTVDSFVLCDFGVSCSYNRDEGEDQEYVMAAEFDWMVPAGHSTNRRDARNAWISSPKSSGCWTKKLEAEEAKEVVRRQNYQQFLMDQGKDFMVQQGATSEGGDAELAKSLEDIGLLRDVKQMLEEMDKDAYDKDEYRCWPHLHRLSIYQDNIFGLQPEAEIRRICRNG